MRILLLFAVVYVLVTVASAQKTLLKDVQVLTLRKGEMTKGRRSSPVPQLKCVGGSAKGAFEPRAAQCLNQGFDGVDYQWKCTADMPEDYEFGKITVSCEGYNHPDDPYVLSGSCGLEYELEYTPGRGKTSHKVKTSEPDKVETFGYIVVILFILFVFFVMCSGRGGNGGDDDARRRGGHGFDGGPGYPGYPGGAPPPSYDDATGPKSSSHRQAGDAGAGPGFWTGAGLGALGGYMAGSMRNRQPMQRQNDWFTRDTGFERERTDGPSTSQEHTSTGYGGTSRR